MARSYCAGVRAHALPGNHPYMQIWNGTRFVEINAKDLEEAKLRSFLSVGARNNSLIDRILYLS